MSVLAIQLCWFTAGTNSYKQVSSHHRWIVSVVIGVSCTFVVSVLLLVCWLHWYRSNILATSYGMP